MTPEERIAQLEAALALERAKTHELSAALAVAVQRTAEADAARARREETEANAKALRRERNRRYRDALKTEARRAQDVSVASPETSPTPSPSLPPPFPSPSLSAPISPPPISSPNPSSPPSFSLLASEPLPGRPEKKAKEAKKEPTGDPRHAPLSLALTALGWPHHGGRTAKALKGLLALADQVPATAGGKAHAEILRRAAKARASTGFPQVRELHELATHWGHFAGPPAVSSALPRADDPDWVTV